MIISRRFRFLMVPAIALGGIALAAGQPPAVTGPFTAEQAASGRAAYQVNCASCHRADLRGSGEASPLIGGNFMTAWGDKSARDLHQRVHGSMPPDAPGTLDDATYLAIVAYILQANGAPAGPQALTAAATQRIGAVATGQAPAQSAQQATPAAGGGRGRGGAPAARPRGLTVTGEVKNYVPVTQAMLKHPDPGDWLMVRRNYQAWSDSPLSQITTDNVRQLRLAWVWTMNDGAGRNQPTPLVHNGIMYLVHPGHIVQALDARTGDLIWENNVGPASTTALRNLAIYENNVFMATNDARLVALDARNGKVAWDVRIADSARG